AARTHAGWSSRRGAPPAPAGAATRRVWRSRGPPPPASALTQDAPRAARSACRKASRARCRPGLPARGQKRPQGARSARSDETRHPVRRVRSRHIAQDGGTEIKDLSGDALIDQVRAEIDLRVDVELAKVEPANRA